MALACAPEWEAASFQTQNFDPWTALRNVRRPVVVVRPETGEFASPDDYAPEAKAEVRAVEGASHFLPMERPALVGELLRELAAR